MVKREMVLEKVVVGVVWFVGLGVFVMGGGGGGVVIKVLVVMIVNFMFCV